MLHYDIERDEKFFFSPVLNLRKVFSLQLLAIITEVEALLNIIFLRDPSKHDQ